MGAMFESILVSHFARYPVMQLADLYKLIHQAAMGSEHAIRAEDSAREWLTRELAEMGTGPAEPLTDLLSAQTGIVRVHVRPYLASGGDLGRLLEAFIRTANEFQGDSQTLEQYWRIATGLGRFPVAEMDAFLLARRAQGYPAVHHSPEYRHLYRPAYRVVWQNLF